MATGESRGVSSSMPLPPMQYVNLYTDENVKKGRAPKPPPAVKVISWKILGRLTVVLRGVVVWGRVPANILEPERRSGKYRWPQVER